MATKDIAQDLVNLCRSGQFEEAITRYYADDIVSIEPMGDQPETRGRAAVEAKNRAFVENYEIHAAEADGPYINGDQFAVRFHVDISERGTGKRMDISEIGVYTVAGNKIVHERFFMGE